MIVCPHCREQIIERTEWRELPGGSVLDSYWECRNGCDIDSDPEGQ